MNVLNHYKTLDPLKFLAFELGSSAHYTFKNENDATCILNGAF